MSAVNDSQRGHAATVGDSEPARAVQGEQQLLFLLPTLYLYPPIALAVKHASSPNVFALGCEDWQRWAFAGSPAIRVRDEAADITDERVHRISEQRLLKAVSPPLFQAGYFPSMYSFRYWFSTSLTFNCALTTSPMETTPCSLPFSTIGMCRTRFSVITAWI